ncbi:helix-turn-helix transcriptional regulator [Litoribacter ruber]|uniref:helix-turn-helix transcriptional regulator n=1 Tax=Litoribacter ruber TaxID=702568 RepID=UPI001BDA1FCA|nr:helix-turn-helix transcriptional regulator [Litoribacter ruber]MBT0812835.1 helix-turn-helix transcriptional regulator [Litoribacter ruber]
MDYNRIKEVIVLQKSSNKKLAEYMGVKEPTVSNWCTNTKQPSIPDLFKIARFLNVDVRELLVSTKE